VSLTILQKCSKPFSKLLKSVINFFRLFSSSLVVVDPLRWVASRDREYLLVLAARCPREFKEVCLLVLDKRDKIVSKMAARSLGDNESLEVLRGQLIAYDSLFRELVATTKIDLEE